MVTIYIRIWTIKPTSRQMMIIYRTYERTWAAPEETVIGRISHFFSFQFTAKLLSLLIVEKTFQHTHTASFSFTLFPVINNYLLYLPPFRFFLAIYYWQFLLLAIWPIDNVSFISRFNLLSIFCYFHNIWPNNRKDIFKILKYILLILLCLNWLVTTVNNFCFMSPLRLTGRHTYFREWAACID